jgi:hypothetical protein
VNCFIHDRNAAVGLCVVCQKAVCRGCVGREAPRIICAACIERGAVIGFEYRSSATIGGWPLVHICTGIDMVTMRPRVAKGIIAIGNMALGGIAIGGIAVGLVTLGGLSLGIGFALGGAAIGLGLSIGGVAVGSVAVGGAALGLTYALGGAAFAPAIVDGRECDEAARQFFRQWTGGMGLPPHCR